MRPLITGFTPFGDVQVNPSQQIVEYFERCRPDVAALLLPTEYRASAAKLRDTLTAMQPDALIMLGVAQGRRMICLERVALNLNDAAIPDNANDLAVGRHIDPAGPIAYWSSLPLETMLAALRAREIPATISNHAGAYVCNHIFYSARHMVEAWGWSIPCGFIHVPGLLEAGIEGGMALAQMIAAVETCLEVLKAEAENSGTRA